MENTKPKNPNAFPNDWNIEDGMTLRDYFAGKVIQGLSSMQDKGTFNSMEEAHESSVRYAYSLADEMLKQRELC
jgi:hypothetical protein